MLVARRLHDPQGQGCQLPTIFVLEPLGVC
jgi:hypothetical protein